VATCRLNNHNSRHGGTATGPDSRVVVLNIIAPGLRCYIREHIIMDKQSLIFSPNGTLSWIYSLNRINLGFSQLYALVVASLFFNLIK
jgi:hypothetical protein